MKYKVLGKLKSAQLKNHQHEQALVMTPEMELYTTALRWSLNQFSDENYPENLMRLNHLIRRSDPMFVAKLAVYIRTTLQIRTVPLMLVTELAKMHNGDDLVSQAVNGVICNAEEIRDMLNCYELMNDRNGPKKLNRLSKQVQKGLMMAFNKFDEADFVKCNHNAAVNMRDALFLVHPKAKNELQQVIFDKIAKHTLQKPVNNWETELSMIARLAYHSPEAKKIAFRNKWEELIADKRLDDQALLKNLLNILESGVSSRHVKQVCAMLTDRDHSKKSKGFPSCHINKYYELLYIAKNRMISKDAIAETMDALEIAVQIRASDMSGFDHNTQVLLACDVSMRMIDRIISKSKLQRIHIGLMLGMMLQVPCQNATTFLFGSTWKKITSPRFNMLANIAQSHTAWNEVGYGTNAYLVIKELLESKKKMDKIMMFTHRQLWDHPSAADAPIQSLWLQYKAEVAPEAKLYLFDLSGYGQVSLQILEKEVYLITGWSDKIFEVLDSLDHRNAALEAIDKIKM